MPNRMVIESENGSMVPVGDSPACPNCGSIMHLKHGKYGDFWGCSNYPHCTGKVSTTDPKKEGQSEEDIQQMIREVWGWD